MKCPVCGTERSGNSIHCTQCDYTWQSATLKPEEQRPIPQKSYGNKQGRTTASTESRKEEISYVGGGILLFALLLLIVAWAWQEDVQSQLKNPDNWNDLEKVRDLGDSGTTAGRLWNLGVIIAVFGAAVVAFAQARK